MITCEQLLCFGLGVALRRVTRIYAEALAEHELTPAQLFVLTCLGQQDGRQPKELAERVFLDSSSITGLIDRTERSGFLERRPDPADRRALRIYLTERGSAKLSDLEPVLAALQERIHREFFADNSPEQVATFFNLLHRMR